MKIALAQQNYHIGNFELNIKKIVTAIDEAKSQNVDLIIFSELCVCGYPPRDFLEFNDFIAKCYEAVETIKTLSGRNYKNPHRKYWCANWHSHQE